MGMTRWVGQCGRREAAFWAGRCCDLKTSEDGGCDNKAVLGWAVGNVENPCSPLGSELALCN